MLRRELASFFFSWTGYVIIAAVTLLVGLSFVVLIAGLGNDPFTAQVTEMFYGTFYFWLILLLVTPVITMRLFALEKASGTFETLMTTPVGDLQVVAAKFAAAIMFYMVAWLPMLVCLFIVRHFTNQPGALDGGTVGGMYLGIFLTGCLFLSLGCFGSAISPKPDGGGDDQFCAGGEPVLARFSGEINSRARRTGRRRRCPVSTCSTRSMILPAACWTRGRWCFMSAPPFSFYS